jgi:sulfur-carrier protein
MVIRLSGTLLRFVDFQKELRIDAPTVKAGIVQMAEQYPEVGKALLDKLGQVRATHRIFVNGETVERAQIDRAVSSEDVIDILTAITGG